MTHAAPRGQNTPPSGTRPGLPTEPESQLVALSHRASVVRSLECLPDQWSQVLDSPTVRFLVEEWKEEEAEKEEKRSLQLKSAEPGCWIRETDGDGDECRGSGT